MKLFVWYEFYNGYDTGIAFALAKTLEDAQDLIVRKHGFTPSPRQWGMVKELKIEPVAFVK